MVNVSRYRKFKQLLWIFSVMEMVEDRSRSIMILELKETNNENINFEFSEVLKNRSVFRAETVGNKANKWLGTEFIIL